MSLVVILSFDNKFQFSYNGAATFQTLSFYGALYIEYDYEP